MDNRHAHQRCYHVLRKQDVLPIAFSDLDSVFVALPSLASVNSLSENTRVQEALHLSPGRQVNRYAGTRLRSPEPQTLSDVHGKSPLDRGARPGRIGRCLYL